MQVHCDECGYWGDDSKRDAREHQKCYHEPFLRGVPVPGVRDGIIAVGINERGPLGTAAYKLMRVAASSMGSGTVGFVPGQRGCADTWKKSRLTAYLYVVDGRAVGVMTVMSLDRLLKVETCDGKVEMNWVDFPKGVPTIRVVFVCQTQRRKGIAKALAQRVASDAQVRLGDVGHSAPFSGEGRAFAEWCCAGQDWMYATV